MRSVRCMTPIFATPRCRDEQLPQYGFHRQMQIHLFKLMNLILYQSALLLILNSISVSKMSTNVVCCVITQVSVCISGQD